MKVEGKIGGLLELGAGFNPEFTGRENVYLNGSIFGFSREAIDGKIDDIEAFADIGDFVDRPVRTYSSGTYVRLAFAAMIGLDPDILVIDEALAVGDIRFQRKCYRHFRHLQTTGTTILFVSHDRYFVNRIAQRLLVLGNPDRVQLVEGNYDDYCYTLATVSRHGEQDSDHKVTSSKSKEGRSGQADTSPVTAKKWRFSYRKVEDLEKEISQIESQVTDLEAKLSEESTYSDVQLSLIHI